ncbi:hypothetical protein LTR99_001255 [Exophiala xenobiotica]|uniref:Uncharacterized protein n=1 Tax=Vermiconidia calcicola TaxID=1690605 RepID=A0AAV9QNI0_9PEZI|nr:hypothetical protein LTR72_001335 [Exophiala xenobiotica]KAK5545816.1 hypothetical protein LTR25_000826 [Vermiconidia calcicola]KAK5549923.1 hypothetical protein LTR23_000214 [Chaetothyriales sp. CCFEE 6169]KAK5271590.1 hypothetical protein LTR96_003415 [Exophiala xenobiotica]KAK5295770.1 hypothetical protein LTR14_003398 [Exophiala xenobiotica]
MSFSQGSAPEPAELVKRWLQGVQQDTPDTNVVEPAPSWEDLATTHAAVNASGKDYDQHAEENKAEGMCADSYKEERVLNCFYNTGHLPIRPHSPSMRNSRAANHREGEYHIIEGARPEEDKNRKRSHEQVNPSPPSLQDAVGLRKQPARSKDGSDITDPSDKYARKPRRKTRPDRYEYKEDLQRHTARRGSKKVDHKKSGTMLNDEFRAPNVGTGRLTLKPTLGPGMFANGKSSAPMRGQGLPDLSFSEMNFLKKRSLRYHTKLSNERQTKNSKDRSHKPPKDEISSFFSQPLHIEQKMTSAYQTPLRRHDKPTPSPIRRPDRSWRLTDPECSWQNDSEIPILKHFRPQSSHRKSTMSHNDTPTSCVSWSTSPSRKPRQVAAQQRDSDASSHTWKKRNSPLAPERCQIEDSTSIYPQSSVTNRFLEDWATNALLGGVETFGQQGKLYISLEELKALAEERMEHDAPTNASQVELPKTLPSPQPDRQVTAMGDSGEVQDAGQSVVSLHERRNDQSMCPPASGCEARYPQGRPPDDCKNGKPASVEWQKHGPGNPFDLGARTAIRTGPEHSSYWPSPEADQASRVSVHPRCLPHQQSQDMENIRGVWSQGDWPLHTNYNSPGGLQARAHPPQWEDENAVENETARHHQPLSDGLDEFDLQLLQTSPVKFSLPARTVPVIGEFPPGQGEVDWHGQENKERRTPLPLPELSVFDLSPHHQNQGQQHWGLGGGFWSDRSVDKWRFGRSVGISHLHDTSNDVMELPTAPQEEPFTGFSRPHHLY